MSKTAFTQYINDMIDDNVKPVKYYLELEKQQLIDAYIEGYSAPENRGDSEQYYNLKFKDNETEPK